MSSTRSVSIFLTLALAFSTSIVPIIGLQLRRVDLASSVHPSPRILDTADQTLGGKFVSSSQGQLSKEAQISPRYYSHPYNAPVVGVASGSATPNLPLAPVGQQTLTSVTSTGASSTSPSITEVQSFDGISEVQGRGNPPDTQVAAGPNAVMEMTNLEIEIFTKQGAPLVSLTFGQFFNNTKNVYHSLFDPKLMFDAPSGRWFASVGDKTANVVTFAISASSDPMDSWNIYSLSANRDSPDQPTIGASNDKFAISSNEYVGDDFVGAQVWILPKSELIAGSQQVDFTTYGPMTGFESVHPVQQLSDSATLYMVSTGGADIASSDFHFYSVTGVPPGRVEIHTINLSIAPIIPSVSAAQPGTPVGLDTGQSAGGPGDARIQSAVWFNGMLWLTFDDGCTPPGDNQTRSCFRLTQIDTSVSPMVVIQDFDVGAKDFYYFYPALTIDGVGDLTVVFGFSSALSYTCCFGSIAVTGQATTDPLGSFRTPTMLKVGNYSDSGHNFIGTVRYGDYFGASVDPTDQSLLWIAGEYLTQSSLCYYLVSCWGTEVASVAITNPGFTIATEPAYVKVTAGSSNTTNVILSSMQGYGTNVTLSASTIPPGLGFSFSPTIVNLKGGSTADSTLSINVASSTRLQPYTVYLTATDDGHSVSTRFLVVIESPGTNLALPDFGLICQPDTISTVANSPVVSNLTLNSINGFQGQVNVTATVSTIGLNTIPSALDALVSNSIVLVPLDGSAQLGLDLSASSAGDFAVNVTGTSGSLSKSTTLIIHVTDFRILGQETLQFIGGNTQSDALLFTSINGFSGGLQLNASVLPVDPLSPASTISAPSILLNSGWSSSTVTVSSVGAAAKNYTLTIAAGTQGQSYHFFDVALRVLDFSMVVSPSSVQVFPGNSTFVRVSGTATNGYANDVSLSILGLPTCVSSRLGNTTIVFVNKPGYPNSSIVNLAIGTSCVPSSTTVRVRAFDSTFGVYRMTNFTLIISNPVPPSPCSSSQSSKEQEECEHHMHTKHENEDCDHDDVPIMSNSRDHCDRGDDHDGGSRLGAVPSLEREFGEALPAHLEIDLDYSIR